MASSDWYLRHRDGVVHGPYSFDEIIQAAKIGNIVDDTTLSHPVYTKDRWVRASSIQEVRDAMQPPEPPQEVEPPPIESPSLPFNFMDGPKLKRFNSNYHVPKDFWCALFALFDFQFKYYVTPWIVRIYWGFSVFIVSMLLLVSALNMMIPESTHFDTPADSFDWPSIPWKVQRAIGIVYASFSLLLAIRLVLESIIVLFNVAKDVSAIRESYDSK